MVNRDVQIVSIYYYLYRLAGCPMGDNLSGLTAWISIQYESFENIEGLTNGFN